LWYGGGVESERGRVPRWWDHSKAGGVKGAGKKAYYLGWEGGFCDGRGAPIRQERGTGWCIFDCKKIGSKGGGGSTFAPRGNRGESRLGLYIGFFDVKLPNGGGKRNSEIPG